MTERKNPTNPPAQLEPYSYNLQISIFETLILSAEWGCSIFQLYRAIREDHQDIL